MQHVVLVTNKQYPTEQTVYGPFASAEEAATWAFHKANDSGLVQFLALTEPGQVDDLEKLDWIISHYSQACLENPSEYVQSWAHQPRQKVRVARLAKDRYQWDLRKILDLFKSSEQYAEV